MTPNDYGPITALTTMLPIRPGSTEALRGILEALPVAPSPLAGLPETHVGRFTVLTDLPQHRRRRPMAAHLMLAADFSSEEATWVRALAGLRALDPVFELCASWPGSSDVEGTALWLLDHRVDSGFAILSYRTPLPELQRVLAQRRALRGLARDGEGLSAAELRARFVREVAER